MLGGEVGPRNATEACTGGVLILIGAMITAVMFGQMAVLMSNLNVKSTQYQELQDAANSTMKNMKLPEELQDRINDYIIYTQSTMDSLNHQGEFDDFIHRLSPSLKRSVNENIYRRIIEMNDLFNKDANISRFIIHTMVHNF